MYSEAARQTDHLLDEEIWRMLLAGSGYNRYRRHKRLPLHIALKNSMSLDVIRALLVKYPAAARETPECVGWTGKSCVGFDGNNMLPLHYCCENKAPIKVINALLEVYYPEATREKNDSGQLPLHICCENKAPMDVIRALLKEYPGSSQVRMGERCQYLLPLHFAFGNNWPVDVIDDLLKTYPEAAKEEGAGKLPLHYACGNNAYPPLEVIEALINAYPNAISAKDKNGNLPLHIACLAHNSFPPLLLDFMTRGPTPGSVNVNYLTDFLLTHGETNVDAFSAFLDRRVMDVSLLASTPDINGRTALGSAGPLCRAVFKHRLFYLRPLRALQPGALLSHQSRFLRPRSRPRRLDDK